MAKRKLTDEHKNALTVWLAADYNTALILEWFKQRGWPEITRQDVSYHRMKHEVAIEALRKHRRESALNTGLALKEERIARLAAHADVLEGIKWDADEKGRLWNEKAWRETLADIAAEMGDRKQKVEHSGEITTGIRVQEVIVNLNMRPTDDAKV